MGYAYATYLKEYGKVSSDRWCMYAGTPLGGGASGFDWYHNMEILMP